MFFKILERFFWKRSFTFWLIFWSNIFFRNVVEKIITTAAFKKSDVADLWESLKQVFVTTIKVDWIILNFIIKQKKISCFYLEKMSTRLDRGRVRSNLYISKRYNIPLLYIFPIADFPFVCDHMLQGYCSFF